MNYVLDYNVHTWPEQRSTTGSLFVKNRHQPRSPPSDLCIWGHFDHPIFCLFMSVLLEMLHNLSKIDFLCFGFDCRLKFAWFCAYQCVSLQFIGSLERDFHPKCGFVFSSCDLIFAAGGIFDSTGSTERRGSSAKVQVGSTFEPPPAVAPGLGIVVTTGILPSSKSPVHFSRLCTVRNSELGQYLCQTFNSAHPFHTLATGMRTFATCFERRTCLF